MWVWVKSSFSIRPMRSVHSHPPTHFIRHTCVQVVNSNEIHSHLSHSQPLDNQHCSLTLMEKVFASFPTRRLLGSQLGRLLESHLNCLLGRQLGRLLGSELNHLLGSQRRHLLGREFGRLLGRGLDPNSTWILPLAWKPVQAFAWKPALAPYLFQLGVC